MRRGGPLILASASPRRAELLRRLTREFEVRVCPLREPADKPDAASPRAWAAALAYFKARRVADDAPGRWVIGADTIVVCAGRLLGKPSDRRDARRMLELQAAAPADVVTGLALVRRGAAPRRLVSLDAARVWMRDDPARRAVYLDSGQWRGKAGAFGLQDSLVGDALIERVEGSASTVVGLPLERLARLLARAGVRLPPSLAE